MGEKTRLSQEWEDDITTEPIDIKIIIAREKYEQLFANKFNNLDGVGRFLERHKLPKLTEEGRDSLSNPITIKEIEFIT